jgi:hypothetical protein
LHHIALSTLDDDSSRENEEAQAQANDEQHHPHNLASLCVLSPSSSRPCPLTLCLAWFLVLVCVVLFPFGPFGWLPLPLGLGGCCWLASRTHTTQEPPYRQPSSHTPPLSPHSMPLTTHTHTPQLPHHPNPTEHLLSTTMSGRGKGGKGLGKGGAKRHRKVLRDNIQGASLSCCVSSGVCLPASLPAALCVRACVCPLPPSLSPCPATHAALHTPHTHAPHAPPPTHTTQASPSPPSAAWPAVAVSSASPASSTRRRAACSRCSSRT